MRKNTHQRVYFYTIIGGFCVYTARPKRKHTQPERVAEIETVRKAIRKRIARENALIDSLKADMYKARSSEEHKELVERQVERIQEMHRLRIVPAPSSFITPDRIFY